MAEDTGPARPYRQGMRLPPGAQWWRDQGVARWREFAYRIIQEALANVTRHAPQSPARVVLC